MMLRKELTVLLNVCKRTFVRGSCNHIVRSLSSQNSENTDGARSVYRSETAAMNYKIVHPQKVSPGCFVPSHIDRPAYAQDNRLSRLLHTASLLNKSSIEIKSEKQIRGMRDACRVAREVLDKTIEAVQPGVTTDELDFIAHSACITAGAYPSPLLYRGFPKSVCTSVNNVACHGIPDARSLCNGDIINIDVTVYFHGFHGDVSETLLVGDVDDRGRNLVGVARCCRDSGLAVCGPGQPFNVIGETVRQTAEAAGFHVIPLFCGHGIGSYFHGPPDVVHVDNDESAVMQERMTFTVEPVITEGDPEVRILDDGWTAVSLDDSRSAQFEHTVLVTQHGVDILTVL